MQSTVQTGEVNEIASEAEAGNPGVDVAKGFKVMVIDDSKTIRRTAETLLTKEGCQVFTAIDGFDALSKIADHQPDSRSSAKSYSARHHDAASRRLPDMCPDQASPGVPAYPSDHAVQQGRPV
jgi:hypothetical protein